MLTKNELRNIIEKIVVILNREYLLKYSHDVITAEELKKGFVTRWTKKHCEYSDSIDCEDGNFIALTKEVEHREVKLTLKRMKNVYVIRNILLSMLRASIKDEFTPQEDKPKDEIIYTNEKILAIRYQLELGRVNNTILTLEHEKEHLKHGEGCDGKFWMTRSSADGAFANALSLLSEWTPKSQVLPQTPQLPPPPEYNVTSETQAECKQVNPLQDQAINEHSLVNNGTTSWDHSNTPTLFKPNVINSTDELYKPSAPPLVVSDTVV